jgi:hypothetical protein
LSDSAQLIILFFINMHQIFIRKNYGHSMLYHHYSYIQLSITHHADRQTGAGCERALYY